MAWPYHTYEQLVPVLITEADMVQLTNDTTDGETVVSSIWEGVREGVDAEIDGYLGERYAVPLAEVPAVISRLSCLLTRHGLYERRYPGEVPKSVVEAHDRAIKLLEGMAKGKPALGIQPAPAPNTQRIAQLSVEDRVFTSATMEDW